MRTLLTGASFSSVRMHVLGGYAGAPSAKKRIFPEENPDRVTDRIVEDMHIERLKNSLS